MKPKTYALLGLLVAATGGFLAGRISSPARPDSGDPRSAEAQSASRSGKDRSDFAPQGADSRKAGRPSERATRATGRALASAGISSIIRNEDALERYRLLMAHIDGLGVDDFAKAVAEFRALGMTESRYGEYAMLLSAWAKADPTAALEFARGNTSSPFATDTILSAWASHDPEAAIRWAKANHKGEEANPYLVGVIRALATSDPLRATQLITGMPRSVERARALDGLLPSLLAQGNAATREWIDALGDDSLRNGAIMRVAEKFAQTDPAGTLAWLRANPGEAAQRRVDDVFRTWAGNDQPAAMDAYRALPPGDERSNALRGLVSNLAESDPKAAVALMDQNSADVSERTVRHFTWETFYRDPQLAVDQISRLSDEDSRGWMYRRFVSAWIERDRPAATAWLQRNAQGHPVLGDMQQRAQQ